MLSCRNIGNMRVQIAPTVALLLLLMPAVQNRPKHLKKKNLTRMFEESVQRCLASTIKRFGSDKLRIAKKKREECLGEDVICLL